MTFSKNRKHRRRSGAGHKKQARPSWLKWGLLATTASVAVTSAIFAAGAIVGGERADADFCYDRPDQDTAALFLDNSLNYLTAPQLRDYRTGFEQAYNRARANTRLFIFTTASDVQGSLVQPVFTICKPAATPQEQEGIGAPSKLAPQLKHESEEARAAYDKAVENALADAQDPSKAAGDSPILEQLQGISRFDGFRGKSRNLTVVTDGVQNSEIARFCSVKGDMPSYAEFEKRAAFQAVRPDPFMGTTVSVLLVESVELPQKGLEFCSNAEMRAWWPDYFKGNGALSVEVTRLRHWAGS